MRAMARRRPPSGRGLTYEKVWAMFQETGRELEETKLTANFFPSTALLHSL